MGNNIYLLTLQANCATIYQMRKHTMPTQPQLTSSDYFVFLRESLAEVLTNQSVPFTKARFQNNIAIAYDQQWLREHNSRLQIGQKLVQKYAS